MGRARIATGTGLVPRREVLVFVAAGAGTAVLVWVALYVSRIPARHTVHHWDLAWAGFDLALAVALGVTAWAALRRRPVLVVSLIVSAVLLACDAWFDVVTALGTDDDIIAVVLALAAELPLAAYFAWRARAIVAAAARPADACGEPDPPPRTVGVTGPSG